MPQVIDKPKLKAQIKDLLLQEPESFKKLLKEVMEELAISSDQEFDDLLKQNFNRFGDTFRALA